MKKIVSFGSILTLLLITILLTTAVFAVTTFKDTEPSDWYMDTVSRLVSRGGIEGYPDNTFRPNKEITKAEFVKTVVASLGFDEKIETQFHWSSNYIRKAIALDIIDVKDFSSVTLDQTISRNDMAKVAVKTLGYNGEKFTEDYDKYANQIKDFDSISSKYQDYVLKAYSKGIITGYPDGTFKGDRGLTRAEASTVIIRILEAGERILPEEPKEPEEQTGPTTQLTEEDIKRLQSYPLNPIHYLDKESAMRKYKTFDVYYGEQPGDCELIHEKQLFTPIKYPPSEIKGKTSNLKWFSSPRLIYKAIATYGVRGVLQKTENGKIYEADFEIMVNNELSGAYLDDEKYGKDYSGRLSEWKEVK